MGISNSPVKGEEHPRWAGWHKVIIPACPSATTTGATSMATEAMKKPDTAQCVKLPELPASRRVGVAHFEAVGLESKCADPKHFGGSHLDLKRRRVYARRL